MGCEDGCGASWAASGVGVWVPGSSLIGGPNAGSVVWVRVLGGVACGYGGLFPGRGAAAGVCVCVAFRGAGCVGL